MKSLFYAVFLCFLGTLMANESPPKVQVYTRTQPVLGQTNNLICHVSGFHPPAIKIELMKDNVEIPGANQTDLAFEHGWQFHLTRFVPFTPQAKDSYTCRVTHLSKSKTYTWEPDMM